MGQIQDIQYPENKRITHGEQTIDATDKQAVDKLLQEKVHVNCVYSPKIANLPFLTAWTTGT